MKNNQTTLLTVVTKPSRKRKIVSTHATQVKTCAPTTSTSNKKTRQNKTNNNTTNRNNCPSSPNGLHEQIHVQIESANQQSLESKTPNLKDKNKTTKRHKKNETPFSVSYNPLLGLSDPLPSHPDQATLIGQQFPVVTIPVIQTPVYSRPNPPSTILASQNFPPFPPDPGNSPQSTSL